jgi:hypothetical protein
MGEDPILWVGRKYGDERGTIWSASELEMGMAREQCRKQKVNGKVTVIGMQIPREVQGQRSKQ